MEVDEQQAIAKRRRVLLIGVLLVFVATGAIALPHSRSLLRQNKNSPRLLGGDDDLADDYFSGDDANNDDGNAEEEEEEEEEEQSKDSEDERHGGLEFDDQIYIDDDYVDDYYAYEEDPGRPKLLPLQIKDILGFLFASMGVILASGGGIGGGGIVVPVYILVMGLSPRDAIPISAVTVFGGSLAATMINFRKRHPLADRPLIDWSLVLVMEPLVLCGALIGTVLHRVLAEKLLVVLLVALLSVTAHTTLSKARRMYQAETVYIEKLKEFHRRHPPWTPKDKMYSPPPVPTSPHQHDILAPNIPAVKSRDDESQISIECNDRQEIMILNPDFVSLRSDMLEEEKITPRDKIIAVCSMFFVVIFLNIMVGGGAFQSPWGIRCGSLAFWTVHVIIGAFLVATAWAAQVYLVNRHEIKELVSFTYVHGDIRWDRRGAVIYPLVFMAAGIFAGIFGIGGGMIAVPLLLTMGVHPMVATATSSCMILFTSVASVTSFAIFDILLWDYAPICLAVGFFPTLLGQIIMKQARQAGGKEVHGHNFERNSIIAYSIGGVVLLSALLMTIQYILSIIKYESSGDEGGMCEGYRRGTVR